MTLSRACPETAARLFARLTIVVGLLFSAPSDAPAQDWPTTEFELLVVDYKFQRMNPILFGPLQALLASWGLELNMSGPLDLPDETRTEIEALLHESAELLDQWGFPPPDLRAPWRQGGVYRVFIVDALDVNGSDVSGLFHATDCTRIREPAIFLDAGDVLRNGDLTLRGRQTVAHELFHAVQYSTAFFRAPCSEGQVGAWITEGTARAVGWDLVRLLHDLEVLGELEPWGARSYSHPLPVPLRHGLLPATSAGVTPSPYPTASFWRYLAESYAAGGAGGTPPGPTATTPFDYSFLARMFATAPLARDCDTDGAPCASELQWLDLQIRNLLGAPLHDLYTRFVGTAILYGEQELDGRAFFATGSKGWRERLFPSSGCWPVELSPESIAQTEAMLLYETAARCFRVSLAGFGGDVNLAVTVKGSEASWTVSDLSSIAARPEGGANLSLVSEPQRMVRRTNPGTEQPEVAWWFGLPDDATSYVIVTNVADDPADTRGMSDLTITFTALPRRAVASYSGPVEGGGGFGDLADDIAAGAERFVTGEPSVSVMILPTHPGHCHLRMNLLSDIGDMVDLNALLPQPIMEGAYPIQAIHEGQSLAPSSASIQVRMSCDRPGSDCMGEGFGHISEQSSGGGSLELLEVSKDVILGEFVSPMTGHEDYVLAGRFVSPLFGAWGRLRRDHPCSPSSPISIAGRGRDEGDDEGGGEEDRDGGRGGGGDEDGGGDDGSDGAGGLPGGEAPPEPDGELPPAAGAQPPAEADEAPSDPDPVTSDVPLGPSVVLDFLENGGSALESEPQVVQGAGSLAGVAVSSQDFDLTIALSLERLLDCSMEQTDPAGYLELLEVGRHVDGLIVLEIEAGRLRLDAAGGAAEFVIEGNGIEIRGTDPGFLSLESSGPGAIHGDVSAATLEISVDGAGFSCEKLMDVSFTVAEAR